MLEHVAQDIAAIASNITGYYIVITDENGIIIGTSKEHEERLGALHEGSLAVIQKREMIIHDEEMCRDLVGTFPGVTLPVFLNDDIVGTVGIRGISDQVQRYGMLVKIIAEVMLRDKIEAESKLIRYQNRQIFINMLMTFNIKTSNLDAIKNYGKLLGYDMERNWRVVLVRIGSSGPREAGDQLFNMDNYTASSFSIIRNFFGEAQNIVVSQGSGKYLILAASEPQDLPGEIREQLEKLRLELRSRTGDPVYIGVGENCAGVLNLHDSYSMAEDALLVAMQKGEDSVVMIEDFPLEQLIVSLLKQTDTELWTKALEYLGGATEDLDFPNVVTAWCESGFRFTETAQKLGIHRNTLMYRFGRYKEVYGIDLYDYKRVIATYFTIKVLNMKNG